MCVSAESLSSAEFEDLIRQKLPTALREHSAFRFEIMDIMADVFATRDNFERLLEEIKELREDGNRRFEEICQGVLGFEFVMGTIKELQEILTSYQQDRSLDYAMMKCGNVEVMFQAKRSLAEALPLLRGREIGGTLTLYMELGSVSELYERIKDKVTIVKDLHTTFYGMQEFYIEVRRGGLRFELQKIRRGNGS